MFGSEQVVATKERHSVERKTALCGALTDHHIY